MREQARNMSFRYLDNDYLNPRMKHTSIQTAVSHTRAVTSTFVFNARPPFLASAHRGASKGMYPPSAQTSANLHVCLLETSITRASKRSETFTSVCYGHLEMKKDSLFLFLFYSAFLGGYVHKCSQTLANVCTLGGYVP